MRRQRRRRYCSKADEELAALIARTNWPEIAGRLLLFVLEQLAADGQLEGRYRRAKSYVEQAVSQFFENQHEFTLVPADKLFDCLVVIANCLIRDDAEEVRKRAERAAPVSMDAGSIRERLWGTGGEKQS